MNFQNPLSGKTWLLFFVGVIPPSIKSSTRHPQVKCYINCGGFSKGMKDMVFHDLVKHVQNYLIGELSSKTNNMAILTKHKVFQQNVLGITELAITFNNV
jgi:hypothetical protein